MSDVDLLKLDRDVARAARAERAWWRTLRADVSRAADDAWYEPVRHVTTRTTYQEVAALSPSDPLRAPMLAWIERLALTRIASRPIVAAALARQAPSLRLEKPAPGEYSARALVRRVLTETETPKARAWLDGLAESAPPILAQEKLCVQAAAEIASRLGVPDDASRPAFDRAAARDEAESLLRLTNDLASSLFGGAEDLATLAHKLVARDVPGVWPTRPDSLWLFDRFEGTPLLQGLTLDLGPTPSPLGAASFARALARLGAAYARVAVLGRAPFVLSADPSELHPFRRGALLASLALDPIFLRKHIGLSRDAASGAIRALAATFLADLRLAAVSTRLDVASAPPSAVAEAVEEALKVRTPVGLSGVFPRVPVRPAERLVAALLAVRDGEHLRREFDEDWFRNPRGLHLLREMDAVPREPTVKAESLLGTAASLAKALEAAAG